MMQTTFVWLRRHIDIEALFWAVGLFVVAIGNPESNTHFTLFWPQWIFGIQSPGYGLGHSIGFLFRGDLQSSWDTHWFGIPAVTTLLHRIVSLQWRRFSRRK